MRIVAFIDGSSYGNPGEAGYGIVLKSEEGTLLKGVGRYIGKATNNVAEYRGLIGCLELVPHFNPVSVRVLSDSELLVRQLSGRYRVKQPHLMVLFQEVKALLAKASYHFEIRHIPREENRQADALARRAVHCRSEVDEKLEGSSGPDG